jgi:hypothetical protein
MSKSDIIEKDGCAVVRFFVYTHSIYNIGTKTRICEFEIHKEKEE